MKYYVFNRSDASTADVTRALAAVQKQVQKHAYPVWNVWVELSIAPSEEPSDADGYITLVNAPPEGSGGEHSYSYPTWLPSGRVEVTPELSGWTVTLSHEVLEMLVNPRTDRLVRGPAPYQGGKNTLYVEEICDPVSARKYELDDISVSDFVYPGWFTLDDEERPTTYLGDIYGKAYRIHSLQLTPGGFAILEDMDGNTTFHGCDDELREWARAHARGRGLIS